VQLLTCQSPNIHIAHLSARWEGFARPAKEASRKQRCVDLVKQTAIATADGLRDRALPTAPRPPSGASGAAAVAACDRVAWLLPCAAIQAQFCT
jgi:hypothetical protein